MATAAEYTFMATVARIEGVRQTAKAAAFATWAFQPGTPLTTYITAMEAADNAYLTALNAALSTAGGVGISVPNAALASQVGDVVLGNTGSFGPFTGSLSTTLGKYA